MLFTLAQAFAMSEHRMALLLFAVILGVVIAVASVTTLKNVNNTRKATNGAPPGTRALAKPHAPLERAVIWPIAITPLGL